MVYLENVLAAMGCPRFFLVALLGELLCACSTLPSVTSAITPYRMDIRQGNMVTQEMVAQLKPGMTRDQVRFALGTPLVADAFHGDRWDYIYRFKPGRGQVQQRRVTVFFEDGRLARLTGDVVAAEQGETAASDLERDVTGRNRVIEIGKPPEPAGTGASGPSATSEVSAGEPEGTPSAQR